MQQFTVRVVCPQNRCLNIRVRTNTWTVNFVTLVYQKLYDWGIDTSNLKLVDERGRMLHPHNHFGNLMNVDNKVFTVQPI